jgi:hypothetical protein
MITIRLAVYATPRVCLPGCAAFEPHSEIIYRACEVAWTTTVLVSDAAKK